MSFSEQLTRIAAGLANITNPNTGQPMQCLLPMPEGNIEDNELPLFGIGVDDFQITPSNVSIYEYPVTIYYFHERVPENGRYTIPPAVYDIPVQIFETLAAYLPLTHNGYGLRVPDPAGTVGAGSWYDRAYIGCQLSIVMKEKENTQWM